MEDGSSVIEVEKNCRLEEIKNKMSFKFEKLRIWQLAMDMGEKINQLALEFPAEERFNLADQMRRAADSVALNISEGSIEQSGPEFRRFLGYSIRSLAEVVTCLHKANRRSYLSKQDFTAQYESAFDLMNMIIAFRKQVK